MLTKYLLKILGNSLSLLMILPFSSGVMYSVNFILFEKRGLPAVQIFVITSLSFSCYTYT